MFFLKVYFFLRSAGIRSAFYSPSEHGCTDPTWRSPQENAILAAISLPQLADILPCRDESFPLFLSEKRPFYIMPNPSPPVAMYRSLVRMYRAASRNVPGP